MGFFAGNTELKCNINLSEKASQIVQDDRISFCAAKGELGFATYINNVFTNYYEQAQSTISLRVNDYKEKIESLISQQDKSLLDINTENLVSGLLSSFIKDLQDHFPNCEKGVAKTFRLNLDNYDILTNISEDNQYYNSRSKYIKAVIEEFCQHEYSFRERVYFSDIVHTIETVKKNRRRLQITYLKPKDDLSSKVEVVTQVISPIIISTEKLTGINCLLGFIHSENGDEGNVEEGIFPVSSIHKAREIKKKCVSDKEAAKSFIKRFNEKGASLTTHYETILVRLIGISPEDLHDKNNHSIQFRKASKRNEYYFECTRQQARELLRPLGSKAIVLQPKPFFNELLDFYANAVKVYGSFQED